MPLRRRLPKHQKRGMPFYFILFYLFRLFLLSLSNRPFLIPHSFMEEGFDHDDRYRMVEDEFLAVAQTFTKHLHAAEYARMKHAAKAQNAATINSISRPVTMKMPEHTKRKLDAQARAKKQAGAIKGVLGKGSGNESEDERAGKGWRGTSLNELMESPRKSAASLRGLGSFRAATKAAAGIKKPQRNSTLDYAISDSEEDAACLTRPARQVVQQDGDDETTDDDNDLDAQPPYSTSTVTVPAASRSFKSSTLSFSSAPPSNQEQSHRRRSTAQSSATAQKEFNLGSKSNAAIPATSFSTTSSTIRGGTQPSAFIKRKAAVVPLEPEEETESRLNRIRERRFGKVKKEEDEKKPKELDMIPTFL
jgi:hypothetical protein